MKRFALIFVSIAATVLSMTSCSSDDDDVNPNFDESLIIGKWKSGTLYERYDLDYSGATWDTADDVKEEEAQNFTWTITKDQLEQIHIMKNGVVPKVYTITNLTATTLVYEDAYGKSKSFSKI
ncbi:hypothetical protein [Marinifilum flexuosum]|uniref:hypothetical protein n=1 Tax=Marinifilum flexuosum TaxID=1117708 RepID=UPI0024933EBA|nr:hypothetical protein [Marinifilum flexuosum]